MVLSLAFPMKLMKRSGKASDSVATFPFNHPRQRQSNDDSSSLGTASLDDDSASFNASGTEWGVPLSTDRNSITFDTSSNEEYANDIMQKSDLRELWYQPSDYQLFRTMALDASQQIIATEKRNRAPHSYQRVLERTYAACCNHTADATDDVMEIDDSDEEINHAIDSDDLTSSSSAITTDSVNEKVEGDLTTSQSHSVVPAEDFIHLKRWLEVGSSRIGLEKWSIRTISTTRSTRRDTMIETIMSLQQEQQYTKTLKRPSTVDQQHQQSLHDEFIRGTCERLSRPSTLFCLVMAQGLAAAVAKENFYNAM